jgi:ABC-type multidrug transport system fused ATPase/permease subunit
MSQPDSNGEGFEGEAREEALGDLDVLDGDGVRGGAERRGDDGPEESISFVYMERVRAAARLAAAHGFVERLPLGYETRVGESGLKRSGGQQQRIAIARAAYHRPPVLLFDEATSSLDTESERAVKENVDELLEGRTSFVIAHRLSTIRDADLIAVLERGRLVEQGTHDDLMERRGLYYYLVSQQLDV